MHHNYIVLAIVGTQRLCPSDKSKATRRIQQAIKDLKPQVIISGGAKGVDTLAAKVAVDMGYIDDENLLIYRPKDKRWDGEKGYRARNEQIALDCTHLLRIHCMKSHTFGSGWTAMQATALGKVVVQYEPCE